jgi:hypothetical protein
MKFQIQIKNRGKVGLNFVKQFLDVVIRVVLDVSMEKK